MADLLNKSYSLAALLIHGSKQEVTVDRMRAIFAALNLEFSSKIASMFAFSSERYESMLSCTGAAPAAAASSQAAAPSSGASKKEAEQEDGSSSSCVLDF